MYKHEYTKYRFRQHFVFSHFPGDLSQSKYVCIKNFYESFKVSLDMKYNAHIYCAVFCFDLYRLKSFCFPFVLMESLKTSPALLTIIITFSTCRGGFILLTKVAQSSLITHDPRLRKRRKLSDPLTPPRHRLVGRLTGVKLG